MRILGRAVLGMSEFAAPYWIIALLYKLPPGMASIGCVFTDDRMGANLRVFSGEVEGADLENMPSRFFVCGSRLSSVSSDLEWPVVETTGGKS